MRPGHEHAQASAAHAQDPLAVLLAALRERDDRLIDQREVCQRTSLHRNTIYKLELKGAFPKRRVIAGGKVVWRASEIGEWIASRPTADKAREMEPATGGVRNATTRMPAARPKTRKR